MLMENRLASEQSLRHLQEHRTCDREVLDGLIKAHGELDKADKATQKSLKKEIDQRCKSLEMLKEHISHYEAELGQELSEGNAPGDDGQICHGAQAEVALAPAADAAPSESAMTPVTPASNPSPAEDQTQDMEVDDYAARPSLPSLASPVSMRMMTYCWACLKVRQQRWSQAWPTSWSPLQGVQMGRVRKPPFRRHSPSHTMLIGRHFLWVPPELH